VFAAPRLGSICFHPSLLPRYRGGSAIPWQIIKGETRTGVSVFWVDPGIDTGPILLQKAAAIGPDDTAGSLYYNTLYKLGVETVLESVDLVAAGRAPRVAQDESQASYDPLCRDEHAAVDWRRPVADVYNLIRGCDPQPGAYVVRGGEKVRFYDARRVDTPAAPGVVAAIDERGIVVGAAGGSVLIGRLRAGDKKLAARDAAPALGLTVGAAL
jgi:methionyl-tRNA formyltransferase